MTKKNNQSAVIRWIAKFISIVLDIATTLAYIPVLCAVYNLKVLK